MVRITPLCLVLLQALGAFSALLPRHPWNSTRLGCGPLHCPTESTNTAVVERSPTVLDKAGSLWRVPLLPLGGWVFPRGVPGLQPPAPEVLDTSTPTTAVLAQLIADRCGGDDPSSELKVRIEMFLTARKSASFADLWHRIHAQGLDRCPVTVRQPDYRTSPTRARAEDHAPDDKWEAMGFEMDACVELCAARSHADGWKAMQLELNVCIERCELRSPVISGSPYR